MTTNPSPATREINVSDLARELGITPATVLFRASDEIHRVVKKHGLAAADDLSLSTKIFKGITYVYIPEPLADRLRAAASSTTKSTRRP